MLGGPDLLWGGVVPGVVALATLTIAWKCTGKAASAWRTAFLLGYLSGHWTLSARDLGATALLSRGELESAGANWAYDPRNFDFVAALTKSFNATEAHDWLPLLTILAILPDALACVGRLGPALGWILRIALCVLLPWRLLYGSAYLPLSLGPEFDFDLGGWSTTEAIAWIGGLAAALLAVWHLLRIGNSAGERTDGNVRSWLAVLVTLGSVIVMVSAKSLILGQLLGALTATLTGCALASGWLGTKRGPDAAAGPIAIAFGTLLIAGHFYAELSLANASLLFFALTTAAGWLPLPQSLSSRWQSVCRGLMCLALLALPVFLAGHELAGQAPKPGSEPETGLNPYDTFRQ